MSESDSRKNVVTSLAADIVAAYVSHNKIAISDLPNLLRSTYDSLASTASAPADEPAQPLAPAVSIRKSLTDDYLICLEDGRKFKSLKRHLRTKYGLTPEQYRTKWKLPSTYPMVAPSYAAARSSLAKQMGLGQKAMAAPEAEAAAAKAPAQGSVVQAPAEAAASPQVAAPKPARARAARKPKPAGASVAD